MAEPIDPANGDVTHSETDFSIPNLGAPLEMVRSYDSLNTVASGTAWSDRGMGDGWSFTDSDELLSTTALGDPADRNDASTELIWFTDGGIELKFTANGSGYNTPAGVFGALTHDTADHWYVWTDETGAVLRFDDGTTGGTSGRLLYKLDRYGDGVEILYNGGTTQIQAVERVLNGSVATGNSAASLAFTYTRGHITAITDFTGRIWLYAYDSAGRLISVTAPISATGPLAVVHYAYYCDITLNDLLASVTDPDGNMTSFTYYVNRRGFQVTQGTTAARRATPRLFPSTFSATARPSPMRTAGRPTTTTTTRATSSSSSTPTGRRSYTHGPRAARSCPTPTSTDRPSPSSTTTRRTSPPTTT